jgi:hypothetical protein
MPDLEHLFRLGLHHGRSTDRVPLAFYRRVFDRDIAEPLPNRLEVQDIDAILSRVWDFGGTILSVSQPTSSRGAPTAATVADPSGRLVSIVQSASAA